MSGRIPIVVDNRLLDLCDVIQLPDIANFLEQQPDTDWLNGDFDNDANQSENENENENEIGNKHEDDESEHQPYNKLTKKSQIDDENEYADEDENPLKKEAKEMYSDVNEYICQNPSCRFLELKEEIEKLHNYEINGDKIITICNYCYDDGYRFCLFTHKVKHIEELDPVLENMYAQKNYHHNQLNEELLKKIPDLSAYFQIIGIDNPCPTYNPIDLTSEIQFV